MRQADFEMARMVEASEKLDKDCKETSTQFQREMCGLKEMRQSIYWKFVNNDQNKVIQDCQVSDWTAEQCSKNCLEDLDDSPGMQILKRTELSDPSNYGTAC